MHCHDAAAIPKARRILKAPPDVKEIDREREREREKVKEREK
jgi:hypothetical protein